MSDGAFRILSLDGGGIRGAFAASFLAELERQLRRPIHEYFDLIAGTSTGGIIATALALGEPATRLEEFYRDRAQAVFERPAVKVPLGTRIGARLARGHIPGLDAQWLRASKYRADALRLALVEVFGNKTLGDASRRLVVPAVDLARGQTIVFKTPHLPDLHRDRYFRAVEVVLATTAAPSYFPHATIGPGSAYCDGGLWANNPAVVAYAEACQIAVRCRRAGIDLVFRPDDVSILSVGTGRANYALDPPGTDAGLVYWGPKVLDVMGASQSQGVDFQARYLVPAANYKRIDFALHDRSWTLDALHALPRLMHLGREAAVAELAGLRGSLLAGERPAFTPF